MNQIFSAIMCLFIALPATILGIFWFYIKNGWKTGMELAEEWLNDQ